MPLSSLPPEKQAEIEDLEQAIREAVDAEIRELAASLATTDDANRFGRNEFTIRALAHKIAAKAPEQHLARKKMDMKGPAWPARIAGKPPSSIRTAGRPPSASWVPSATAARM